MRNRLRLALTAVGLIGGWAASGRAEEPAANQVSLDLVLSEREYDPASPSDGRLKCVVRNGTAKVIDVPVGYDGTEVQLVSGALTLRLAVPQRGKGSPKKEGDVRRVRLDPGKEQLIFELHLNDILLKEEKSRKKWRWDWLRRPEPPRSPVHRWRKPGFHEEAAFHVNVTIGRKAVQSDAVVLKVRANDPAK